MVGTQASLPVKLHGELTAVTEREEFCWVSNGYFVKPGEGGNCKAIAETKRLELAHHGISSTIMTCRLKDGQGMPSCY